MTVAVVLDRLRQSGWSVEVLEGHLSLEPMSPDVPEMTDAQRKFLAKHKAAIIDALALEVDTTDKLETYEEHAAIMQYDGGLTMKEAEQKAGTYYYCRHWQGTRSGKGYCCIGYAPPVKRIANESCEQFTLV